MHRLRGIVVFLGLLAGLSAIVATSSAQAGRSSAGASSSSSYVFPAMGHQPLAPSSIFGLDHGTFDENFSDYNPKEFVFDHKLGGRWTHFNGNSIGWKNGKPDWTSLDLGIKLARTHHLEVMLTLGGEPHACSIHPTPTPIYNCPPTTSADLTAYKSFVTQEVLRYRKVVDTYESWIEPNHTGKWPPYPNPAQYAKVLETQYAVFQTVNRQFGLHLQLLFAGPNGFSTVTGSSGGMGVLPWAYQVLKDLGTQKPFDGVGLHPFALPPVSPYRKEFANVQGIPAPAGASGPFKNCSWVGGPHGSRKFCRMNWRQDIVAYEQLFTDHYRSRQPLWLTEFGWPGVSKVPHHPQPSAAYYPLYKAQERDLVEAYKIILSLPFIKAASWFNERDYVAGVPTTDPPFYAHMGLLTSHFGFKPAAYAFQRLSHEYSHR